MTTERFTVEVQPDFLERQTKAEPVNAVSELIWNGLDADAAVVDVRLDYNELGMTTITVSDNGHGIPRLDAPDLFTRLGGSWKKPGAPTKTKGRMLHGSEGRGRFKAFALGRVAEWRVTYDAGESAPQLHSYNPRGESSRGPHHRRETVLFHCDRCGSYRFRVTQALSFTRI